jgi:hypothetical protein
MPATGIINNKTESTLSMQQRISLAVTGWQTALLIVPSLSPPYKSTRQCQQCNNSGYNQQSAVPGKKARLFYGYIQ